MDLALPTGELGGNTGCLAPVLLAALNLTGNRYISNAGLTHLRGLTNLKRLDLSVTKVTAADRKSIQAALPGCAVFGPL